MRRHSAVTSTSSRPIASLRPERLRLECGDCGKAENARREREQDTSVIAAAEIDRDPGEQRAEQGSKTRSGEERPESRLSKPKSSISTAGTAAMRLP